MLCSTNSKVCLYTLGFVPRSAVELGSAARLSFDTLCTADKPLFVAFELSFAAEGSAPRLAFLTCHGATIGLGLLRDGTLALIPVYDHLRADKELRDQVQKSLKLATASSRVRLVPGARHRIELHVRPQGLGGRAVVEVRVDGRKLERLTVRRPSGKSASQVVVTALQSLKVHSVSVRGAPGSR